MMTQRDPNVNMLRTTIAALAAGLGGADAISILPHSMARGLPDAFARRVARNTQLILLEESNLSKVSDPAAGSGGLEELTSQLGHAAWALFQEIESAGGAADAIESGLIQQKVAATRAERQAAIAKRKDALTGTSDFPNLGEDIARVLDVARVSVPPMPASKTFPALAPIRLAEPFEQLRDASDTALAATGRRPRIALVELGSAADFTPRTIFAKNLFEAGGIEAIPVTGGENLAAAFRASGAPLACLCSSDEVYARDAADTAKTLAESGAKFIYLAGRPKDMDALQRAGIGAFVFAGCDAVAILGAAHDMLRSGAAKATQ
jgi:methylmalonyl-CoA mutase